MMQNALDADVDRAASIVDGDMICVTVTDHDEEKRLTVDPGQAVHDAIAEAFGCERQEQVQRVLFGDMDVLEGESFEQHGIEVAVTRCPALLPCLVVHSSSPLDLCMLRVLGHRQDGARLSASIKTQKASVADVAAEIVARNPVAAADGGLTVEMLMRNVRWIRRMTPTCWGT